jgi:CubicO group peptidase (beta-lactamase class C family)
MLELTALYFTSGSAANMLKVAFTQGKYSWGPGTEMRYENLHYVILSAAMDAYLKQKEGPSAHLWDMVVGEVYAPIGIAHAPMMHTIESDGSRGIPLMAYGLYPTADDTAKIAQLLQNGGKFNGQQLLSASLTAAALYQTANRGLRGSVIYDNQFGSSRYLMSLWSVAWSDGAGCTTRVPYMLGAGGSLVALLPNGVTAFRYTDSNNEDVNPLVHAGANLGGMCSH